MALEVIMPKAGVDMTEGQIVQWNKKVGEFVKEGEILLEIMTCLLYTSINLSNSSKKSTKRVIFVF